MKFRFLPFMIYFSLAALILKLLDIVEDTKKYSEVITISTLNAEEAAHGEAPPHEEKKPKEKKEELPKISETPPDTIDKCLTNNNSYSPSEVELLNGLAKRREELDKWEKEAALKEAYLTAADMKLNQKLSDLKTLRDEVNNLLESYNEKEDMKISSLVKIYENMKPKDAAKIFEGLDMPILLRVVDKMKEIKAAPIIAQLSTQKASELTTEYAAQKKMPAQVAE